MKVGEEEPLSHPHRAHHEGGDMISHALLFRPRGLQLGRLACGRGALRGSRGLSAVGRLPVTVLVGFVLLVPPLLAVSVRIAPALVPLGVVPVPLHRSRRPWRVRNFVTWRVRGGLRVWRMRGFGA